MNPIILNQEQRQAVSNILDFMLDTNPANNRYVLTGIAGSGKTTILKEVVKQYKQACKLEEGIDGKFIPFSLVFTAMTNVATSVLCSVVGQARTLHSYLKLYPNNYMYTIEPNPYDLIVIDEASMIDLDILRNLSGLRNKILFIGDKTQLPPVGLNHSPVFYQDYPTTELNQSMRQFNNVSVGEYCSLLQGYIKGVNDFPKLTCDNNIIHLSSTDFENQIFQEFQASKNSKVLSLTNRTSMKYAKLISNALTMEELSIGDKVYVNSYHNSLNKQEIYTITHLVPYTSLKTKGYAITLNNSETFFTPFSTTKYKNKERNVFFKPEDKAIFKRLWIDIRHTYSSTIHKAQGSTYDNVFIDLNDFTSIKTQKDLARLLYVAFSRATNKVYLTGDT